VSLATELAQKRVSQVFVVFDDEYAQPTASANVVA
jgi:hypothetical protein